MAGNAPGKYIMDGDNYFCDVGEFCQFYPSLSDPELIEVKEGSVTLRNFIMTAPQVQIEASQNSLRGYAEGGKEESESASTTLSFFKSIGRSGIKINRP